MKINLKLTLLFGLLVVTAALVPIFLTSGTKVSAGIQQPPNCTPFLILFKRCMNQGYFTGSRSDTSGDTAAQFPLPNTYPYADNPFFPGGAALQWSFPAVPGCQDAVQTTCTKNATYTETFLKLMLGDINGAYNCAQFPLNAYDACGQTKVKALGAAMIIDTFLGQNGTNYGNWNWGDPIANYFPVVGAGIQYARDNFGTFASMVRAFNNNGQVIWSDFMVLPSNHFNSTGMNYGLDDEFFVNTDQVIGQFITFVDTNGNPMYIVNRSCGNIEGSPLITIPSAPSYVQGRLFRDDNGNGVRDAGEPIIQSNGSCAAGGDTKVTVNGVYVTVNDIAGSYYPNQCNSPGNTDPYYIIPVTSFKAHTFSVVPPGGWQPSGVFGDCGTNITGSVTCNVQQGKVYNVWFGIKPLTPSCGGVTTSPAVPEPGQQFSVTVSFATSTATSTSFTYTATLSIPGISIPGPNPIGGTFAANSTSSGPITFSGLTAPAGTYAGTYTIGGGTVSLTCSFGNGVPTNPPPVVVAAKPYLRVYGGDVQAGRSTPDSSGSCNANSISNAGIVTYNKDSAGAFAGAGSQYLAAAPGSIYQFASAALRASAPQPASGLTLSNTSNPPWGGAFGTANLVCASDYSKVSGTPLPNPPDVGGGYMTIANNTHTVLTYTGNAYLSHNICYNSCGGNPSYSVGQIPSFYLVVTGNIYISSGVTQLDGVYIALPDSAGNGGRIYTCASGAGSAILGGSIYDNCQNPLTVNGAFIANQVKFLRAKGTLKSSATDHSADGNISELFNYTPELWLNSPGLFPTTTPSDDAITSLPPVL